MCVFVCVCVCVWQHKVANKGARAAPCRDLAYQRSHLNCVGADQVSPQLCLGRPYIYIVIEGFRSRWRGWGWAGTFRGLPSTMEGEGARDVGLCGERCK